MFWMFWRHYTMSEDTATEISASYPAAAKRPPSLSRPSARGRSSSPSRVKDDMLSALSVYGSDAYCVMDEKANCLFLSENWRFISGSAVEEDMGEGLRERIAPDHLPKLMQYLITADADAPPLRFQMKHKGGQWRWCELQIAESRGTARQCILRDITELASMQGKLEKAKLETELAVRSRSEFLANMSHELRTPLNAILGFAQMIEAGTYGDVGHPKYHDYIDNIQESGITLLSRINDLLEIANIDVGRMTLNESSVDMAQAIRQAIEFHSHRAFCEQVTLRQHNPERPIFVHADRIRMLQVLTNLISNAIKYNQPGGSADIYCEVRRDGGVSVMIKDNGGGIPASHLENILSAFRQDNSFFARTRNCVGLGLALSKEIIKLHQGRIEIESTSGKGTLLTIRLPRERTVKTPAAKPESVETHGTKC